MQRKSGRADKVFGRRVGCSFGTVLAIALLAGFLGCKSGTTTEPANGRTAGTVVRVACPGEPSATVVERYGRGWASAERKLEIVRYDAAGGPENTGADVWIVPPAEMPHWAAAGKLQPVPAFVTAPGGDYAWEKLLPLYKNKLLVWDDKKLALPLLGDGWVCCYRKDLLQDAGNQAAFQKRYRRQPGPPDTWEEFVDLAEFFNNTGRSSTLAHSLPPLPAGTHDLDREFYALATCFARRAVREEERGVDDNETFSFHYDLASGAVRVDTAGFVHALEVLQRLGSCRPPGRAEQPLAAFEKGEAVLCLANTPWVSRFAQSATVKDKFGICPVPGSACVFNYKTGMKDPVAGVNRVPYLAGGWVGVVPASSAQPDLAFGLLAFLSGPKTSLDIVIEPAWGGGFFRRTHIAGQVGWDALGLGAQTGLLVNYLRETVEHPQVKNPVVRLRIPAERDHRQAVDEELVAALLHGKTATAALAAAAQRWRELDARKDARQLRNDYRLSLSLTLNN